MAKQQNPPKPQAASEPPDTASHNPRTASHPLPFYLEFSLSVGRLVVILTGLVTAVASWLAGAPPLLVAARSGVAILSLGMLFWVVNWLLSSQSLEIVRQELLAEQAKSRDGESTVEKSA